MSLPSPGLIRLDLFRLRQEIEPFQIDFHNGKLTDAGLTKFLALKNRINKKEADLVVAERRYLKQLAKVLNCKADVYGPNGRMFTWDDESDKRTPYTVRDGKLFHGEVEIDHTKLTDGHGRGIYPHSDY